MITTTLSALSSRVDRRAIVGLLAVCAVIACAETAWAEPLAFTIVSSESTLNFSGVRSVQGIGPVPVVEQGPGSLTTSLSGTIDVDTNLTSTLTFTGGTKITANINGNWQPGVGNVGTQPGQIGTLVVFPGGDQYEVFDFGALGLSSSPLALSAGSFDSTQTTFTLLSSTGHYIDTGSIVGSGEDINSGETALNAATGGMLSVVGNLATLTIPYSATGGNSGDTTTLSGVIVATATIPTPEPSTWSLAALGGLALLAYRRRCHVAISR